MVEMSALSQLAYSDGLRLDVRINIANTLRGNAWLIALVILGIDSPDITETHRAAGAQLQDWATRLHKRLRK